jgi:hypothetical protein
VSEEIVINLSQLTWGEMEELEHHAGAEAASALFAGNVLPSATVVLLWIVKRKTDPSFTLDDARRLPITQAVSVDDTTNPTQGNGAKVSPPSATSTDSAPASSSA